MFFISYAPEVYVHQRVGGARGKVARVCSVC